ARRQSIPAAPKGISKGPQKAKMAPITHAPQQHAAERSGSRAGVALKMSGNGGDHLDDAFEKF
ncbi:MAG: hypothetical protein AB1805_07160, partial [Nitrospirota bacterium]